MHLNAFLQFEHFPDCSIREYQSILDELSSVFQNIYVLCQHYASIILRPIMLFIMLAYLTQASMFLLHGLFNHRRVLAIQVLYIHHIIIAINSFFLHILSFCYNHFLQGQSAMCILSGLIFTLSLCGTLFQIIVQLLNCPAVCSAVSIAGLSIKVDLQ